MTDLATTPHPPVSMRPIRKRVDVPLPPEEAFDLFTRDIARWWPLARHSVSADAGTTARGVKIEPRVGGHVVEEMADGARATWARVTEWSRGRRVVLDWYAGPSEDETTQVTVVFSRIEGGTRVDLTHAAPRKIGMHDATMCVGHGLDWGRILKGYCATASRFCVAA